LGWGSIKANWPIPNLSRAAADRVLPDRRGYRPETHQGILVAVGGASNENFWSVLPAAVVQGVAGNAATGILSAIGRSALRAHRSASAIRRLCAAVEAGSGAPACSIDPERLKEVLRDERLPGLIVTGDSRELYAVSHPIVPRGATTAVQGAIANALLEELRRRAEQSVRALVALYEGLVPLNALLDRGHAGADPIIGSLLNMLPRPGVLEDRDGELAYLAQIFTEPLGYEVMVAPPYTGKTSLLAVAATRTPPGADVLAFFVRRVQGRNTRGAFLSQLIGQLRNLLDEPGPEIGDPDRRIDIYRELWERAASRAVRLRRPLVLIVDGLDEQADEPQPISSLLPADLPDQVTVVVAIREHPTAYVLDRPNHPMLPQLANPWRLTPIDEIGSRQALAQAEIAAVLGRVSGTGSPHPIEPRILLHLAAAIGPLDVADLADLIGTDATTVAERLTKLRVVTLGDGSNGCFTLAHDVFREQIAADYPSNWMPPEQTSTAGRHRMRNEAGPLPLPRTCLISIHARPATHPGLRRC
jgi:hypothetical protein